MMGATGSENTGQASGAAGLIASFGREEFPNGNPLTGNEIRQLLTMTAEDVRLGQHRRSSGCRTRPRTAGTRTSATAG